MRHEAFEAPVADRVAELNKRYAHHAAIDVLRHALKDSDVGKVAMVSSFGAESVALLHLVAVVNPHTPVLFLDTEMLFRETLDYQHEVAQKLGLTDVRVLHPDPDDVAQLDPDGQLNVTDPDACCNFRKTVPLARALDGFDAWITGRKKYQGGARTELDFFEEEAGTGRIKINPLVHWQRDDTREYMVNNKLPKHPLVSQGYPSIGCEPCTSKVKPGEDERAGRWRGQDKDECGIHFVNGKMVRIKKEDAA